MESVILCLRAYPCILGVRHCHQRHIDFDSMSHSNKSLGQIDSSCRDANGCGDSNCDCTVDGVCLEKLVDRH